MDRVPPRAAPAETPSLTRIAQALSSLRPQTFEIAPGHRLMRAGEPLDAVYLLAEGLVAIVARTPGGAAAEAGLVGSGGLVGHAAVLGATFATSDAVTLSTTRGYVIPSTALVRLANERPRVRRTLHDYALTRMAEVERLCVCAAAHSIERRLARWLASAAALAEGRPIEITHTELAELFSVRRASVTTSLHLLEGEQAVRCRRGQVEIRDAARLEAASCGCHLAYAPQPTARPKR